MHPPANLLLIASFFGLALQPALSFPVADSSLGNQVTDAWNSRCDDISTRDHHLCAKSISGNLGPLQRRGGGDPVKRPRPDSPSDPTQGTSQRPRVGNTPPPTQPAAPQTLNPEQEFQRAVVRGNTLYTALQGRLITNAADVPHVVQPSFEPRDDDDAFTGPNGFSRAFFLNADPAAIEEPELDPQDPGEASEQANKGISMSKVLGDLGVPFGTVTGRVIDCREGLYEGYAIARPQDSVFIIANMQKFINFIEGDGEEGKDLAGNDVNASAYMADMMVNKLGVTSPTYVVQHDITQENTQAVFDAILQKTPGAGVKREFEFIEGNQANNNLFFAVVGSVNGAVATRMISDRSNSFRLNIKKVTIWRNQEVLRFGQPATNPDTKTFMAFQLERVNPTTA